MNSRLNVSFSPQLDRLLLSCQVQEHHSIAESLTFTIDCKKVRGWYTREANDDMFTSLSNEISNIIEQVKGHVGDITFRTNSQNLVSDKERALTFFTLLYYAYRGVINQRPYHAVIFPEGKPGFGCEIMAEGLEEADLKLKSVFGDVVGSIWNEEDANELR